MDDIEKAILEVTRQHNAEFQKYILEDVEEIPAEDAEEKSNTVFKQGSYGKIIDLDWNGTMCVGKVLHSAFFQPNTERTGPRQLLTNFFREIKLMSRMQHSNVVEFHGLYYRQDSLLPVLVMEKMDYSLAQYLSIHHKGSISETTTLNILLDVSKGLVYLHEMTGFAHRDLSSNNILLKGWVNIQAKIADFGSARLLDSSKGWNAYSRLTAQPGTPAFMPPETQHENPDYDVSIDVFSFGCVTIHLHSHEWPIPIPVPKGEFISEIDRRQKYISRTGDFFLLRIIKPCLAESRQDRPTSREVMSILQERVSELKDNSNNTDHADYTVVFAGVTGTGKSTAGNFFLNKEVFLDSGGVLPGTDVCMASTSNISGKTVKIIDTPGFFDGFTPSEENFNKLGKIIRLAKDGIHALAFVMSRYSESCEQGIKEVLLFEGIKPFMFVLLTHVKDIGHDETTTQKYIQDVLVSPTCPKGFKDLMEMVDNRVIMVECVRQMADGYYEQKGKEFIAMIENLFKINGNRIYTNTMLQHATNVHEGVKKGKTMVIQATIQALTSRVEKINQLQNETNDTEKVTSAEKVNKITDLVQEVENIKSELTEFENGSFSENLTQNILEKQITECNPDSDNIAEVMKKLTAYFAMSATMTPVAVGMYGGIGGLVGAGVGSIVPVIGTGVGAYVGAEIGALLGGSSVFLCISGSFWRMITRGQQSKTREGVAGVVDNMKTAHTNMKKGDICQLM